MKYLFKNTRCYDLQCVEKESSKILYTTKTPDNVATNCREYDSINKCKNKYCSGTMIEAFLQFDAHFVFF